MRNTASASGNLCAGNITLSVTLRRPKYRLDLQIKERVQKGPAGDPFVGKARIYMALVDNPGTLPDPAPDAPDPDDFNNPTNRPGRQASHMLHLAHDRNVACLL